MSFLETVRYCGGRTEHEGKDGSHWRETGPEELFNLLKDCPDTQRIIVGNAEPKEMSWYKDLYLAGNYPFLVGMAQLLPVYLEVTCLEEAEPVIAE